MGAQIPSTGVNISLAMHPPSKEILDFKGLTIQAFYFYLCSTRLNVETPNTDSNKASA